MSIYITLPSLPVHATETAKSGGNTLLLREEIDYCLAFLLALITSNKFSLPILT
jgi:hypothetical protein